MSRAEQLVAEDKKYFSKAGRVPYYQLVIDHAHGSTVWDVDGKEYLDMLSSAGALNTGHTHEKVVEAIITQTKKMIHYTPAYMYHEPLVKLSKKLTEITPGTFAKKVIFGLSGSDANDALIKFARAYTGRQNIISFINAYHGSTYGSLSMTPIAPNMRRKIGPLLPGMYQFPFGDVYRGMYGGSEPNTAEEVLAPIKQAFESYLPADEVAAVVIEPIQGDGGILVPSKEFMQGLYALCKEHGILFCVDEVQQGMGRTGKWFSIEHFDIEPDLIAIGKSIASGLPLSALVGKAEIMDSLAAPAHVFTTAGNPVSCEASLATIDVIENEKLIDGARTKGEFVMKRISQWEEKYPIVGQTRGIGLSIGIDIVKDKASKEKDALSALKICNRCFEKGVIITTIAKSVLRFQPPLVITEEELTHALDVIEKSIIELLDGNIPDSIVGKDTGW